MKLPFSIRILSMGSPATLHQTLTSYKDNGLLSLTDDVAVYFQNISDTDLAIAEEFSISKVYGDDRNIGIGAAFTKLVEQAKYEHILLLENDWQAVENTATIQHQLEEGLILLKVGAANVIKYRSRFNYGDPLYTLQFKGRERHCPEHMGEAIHWLEKPNEVYPDVFDTVDWSINPTLKDEWYVMTSRHVSHTNNPCLHSREFYLQHISPFSGGGIDLEGNILKYWQSSDFKVAHGWGIFKHDRID